MAENINVPSGPNNLRNAILDMLATKTIDMKMRRVTDASPAQDPNDYVILQQLTDAQSALQKSIDGNSTDITSLKNQTKNPTLPTNLILFAQANLNLTLSTTPSNIGGLHLTLNTLGKWLLISTVFFEHVGTENGANLLGYINVDGAGVGAPLIFVTPTGTGITVTGSGASVCTQYLYNATSIPHTITVQAYKTLGTGSSFAGTQSTLSALWISS